MQLWWGRYAFPANAAEVTSRTDTVFSSSGFPLRYNIVYRVLATLDGNGQVELSEEEQALREALSIPYLDLILRTDTGAVSSAALLSRSSVTGARLTSGPNFSEAQGSEFVNRRTCEFEMSAEYVIRGAENAVVSWTETVSIQGNGGPNRVWRFPLNARPIRQVVTPYSLVRATQTGSAVGHLGYPTRPLPIWPQYLVNPAEAFSPGTPESRGKGFVNYPLSWSYQFEVGGVPLFAVPTLPPLR